MSRRTKAMAMNQADAFLHAILADPEDHAPRLAYADWLDERGDSRGGFIRVQCALAGLADDDDAGWPLLAREARLIAGHGKHWAGPLRRLVKRWRFRRGFVEAVTLRAADFLWHAEALFRIAPVREVRLLHAADLLAELASCPGLARLTGLDL